MTRRVTVRYVQRKKRRGERFAMVTAYDYPTAVLADRAGIPLLLVGDSLGMTVHGHESTIPVTLDMMVMHTSAVARGAERALVVADLPFMTYQVSDEQALRNAGRLMQESGAGAVKLEGGREVAKTVERIVNAGIPVMGHIGLTPQSVHQLGGYRVQGKSLDGVRELLADARALQRAGAFTVVMEVVPAPVAKMLTRALEIPTIGIGAGSDCDGQVQVFSDLFNLIPGPVPKHARAYLDLGTLISDALTQYQSEVEQGQFPADEHSFDLPEGIDETLLDELVDEVSDA